MRVILLSQWYQPEPEIKVHLLARDLVRRGHEVTAITGLPNYPTGRIYAGYRVRPWPIVETMDGVRVVRVPLYPDRSRSVARRLLNYASFATSAALFGPILSGRADVLWVHHPPLTVALPALVLSVTRNIPLVFEIQDMWPETLAATGMARSERLMRLIGRVADRVYRTADRITVISPGFKSNLTAKGVPEHKIEVMPNWADEDVYRPVVPEPELAERLGMKGRFNVLYAGNLGAAQRLDNVLDAAALLRDIPDVQFVFAGEGIELRALTARAEREGLANVRFIGSFPPACVPSLAAISEVMLVHLRRDPLFEITIPSKTISSLACGRPILTVAAGDPADVVTRARAGLACPPDDPRALAECVRTLRRMTPAERSALGTAGREHYLAHFTRASLVPRYEELLREVAERGRRGHALGS